VKGGDAVVKQPIPRGIRDGYVDVMV